MAFPDGARLQDRGTSRLELNAGGSACRPMVQDCRIGGLQDLREVRANMAVSRSCKAAGSGDVYVLLERGRMDMFPDRT